MSKFHELLNWGPVSAVRRNHGLEHATLNLLAVDLPRQPFSGHSDSKGFWIIGEIGTEQLLDTVNRALARMRAGERGLAVHPYCGTNFVTTGLIAGTLAWLAGLIGANNFKKKLERWPLIIMVVTAAAIFSRPLGPMVQARISTSGTPGALMVRQIVQYQRNGVTFHRITTRDAGS